MDPDRRIEFKINGMHGKGVRLIHACRDDDGELVRPTRFTYTPAHKRHERPQENLEILQQARNSPKASGGPKS